MANITIKKIYVEVLDNTKITHIKLELYYTTDKYNQFTHTNIISVVDINRPGESRGSYTAPADKDIHGKSRI